MFYLNLIFLMADNIETDKVEGFNNGPYDR
jgi:hypothetical protein